jgi:hypothetical protein
MKSSAALSDIPFPARTKREIAMIEKIVSGGQTGVDRAALRCGLDLGFEIGGYCPAGYRAEDGSIPERFRVFLACTDGRDYRERTRLNVATSDATLIVSRGPVVAGTALTKSECRGLGKPYFVVQVLDPCGSRNVAKWLARLGPRVLNIAGPRESTSPGIESQAYELLTETLGSHRKS